MGWVLQSCTVSDIH
uniref:Uncharacterized protein n=1 Tax=Anguilla anguilla TaxID=7936 RepID=A0A0E9TUZ4_ANGAN